MHPDRKVAILMFHDDINFFRVEGARPMEDENIGNVISMEVAQSHEVHGTNDVPLCRKGKTVSSKNIKVGLTR